MGQLIDEEDCEVCVPFDQEWIFTYGDLVTLLLCFFILLFATCVYETRKFKAVAESFKPLPPGSPFMQEGRDSVVEQISKEVEQTELGDDTRVTIEEKGVVVSFAASATFEPGSTKLTPEATKEMARFSRLVFLLPNRLQVEGHTDNQPVQKQWGSAWELSGARASRVARFFIDNGMDPKKLTVKGFGSTRPKFNNDSPTQRRRNNRVEVIVLPPVQK
jgi:chemotaxis protein MotB